MGGGQHDLDGESPSVTHDACGSFQSPLPQKIGVLHSTPDSKFETSKHIAALFADSRERRAQLFDYYGEPYGHAWPHVASSYGSFDLAGFPKAAVWFYRALWLSGIAADAPDRPALPQLDTVRIVQDNEPGSRAPDPEGGSGLRNVIQVYSSCPSVELFVNGESRGKQGVLRLPAVSASGGQWAEWSFPFTPGNLTAVGYSSAGTATARHTVETASAATAVVISVDVPSVASGTGEALVLDGQDTGLLRATVVDSKGRTVPSSAHNVTFTVVSGPGRIIAVGNGDPTNHQPNRVAWRSAFHGLVRGIVQVTTDAASENRDMLLQVDTDRDTSQLTIVPSTSAAPTEPIVVEAASPGLQSSRTVVRVSADLQRDGVLPVAARSTDIAFTP